MTAVSSGGEGPASNEIAVRPATVPGSPGSVSARTATTAGVNLTWKPPTSNGGSPVTGYAVYRSRTNGTEVSYATVSCSTTACAYNDTGTLSGATYYYKVAAVNAAGTGKLSNQVSAKAR